MAGRGRGATLPAWMTAGGAETSNGGNGAQYSAPSHHAPAGQFDDYNQPSRYPPAYSAPIVPSYSAPPPMQYNVGAPPVDHRNSGYSDRPHDDGRSGGRDVRKRSRSRSNTRSATSSAPTGSKIGSWKRGGTRVSNFDVRPPDGVELPPIGVSSTQIGVPNSYFSYANNPAVTGTPLPGTGHAGASKYGAAPYAQPKVDPNSAAMLTRHARRIYAGGIPPRATEIEIANFFNDVVTRALAPTRLDGPPVQKVYLNTEKCYAFVEFGTIELTTACMQLDGVKFEHYTGTTIVRVRRPNDYRPELLPPNLGPIPQLNLEVLGLTGASAPGGGPGKIFIGGLPYNLSDEQIMELLGAFGPIRSFHQVRDPGSITSKGYGFCEYVSPANAEAAIAGLNGMALGEKTLSVRVATQNAGGASAAASNPLLQQQMLLPGMGAMGHMGNMGMNMNMGMNPAMGMMGGGGYGAAAPSGLFGGAPPSRVLRLSNMITRDDLYNETEYLDIREDVRLECQQYGKVHSVVIPRARDGFNPAAECLIFVEFETLEGSRAAANVLNGRKFADNTVVVAYYNERDFATQHLI